ncbi:MAG: alpha/beta fold hydrolase [Caulobacterales bacterium]|nr:alpha/beta fold hydrolase [Caulobacterales bacterium]
MSLMLDGPRRPPRRGAANALVVLIHGYGANGQDLIGLADPLAAALPGAYFVAPDAPEPVPGVPGGRQWFAITRLEPAAMAAGVRAAAPGLARFIEQERARHGLDGSRVALVGFSQGAMLAMHVGPRQTPAPAAVVGFSGVLCDAEALKSEAVSKPPILLAHGDSDDVVPTPLMWESASGLAAAEFGVIWHLSQGVPHGIGPDALDIARGFLARRLARPAAAATE